LYLDEAALRFLNGRLFSIITKGGTLRRISFCRLGLARLILKV